MQRWRRNVLVCSANTLISARRDEVVVIAGSKGTGGSVVRWRYPWVFKDQASGAKKTWGGLKQR